MSNKKTTFLWVPLMLGIAMAIGVYLGRGIMDMPQNDQRPAPQMTKIDALMAIINAQYVDTVNMEEMIEEIVPEIVSKLDPHSVYIPAKDLQATNEELEGSFSGIGVQFNIQRDTVMVVQVIPGGPSERVGLMPGDRIVFIDDSTFTGKSINNEKVMKTLRGEKGTPVKLGIKRNSAKDILNFEVIRGDIPVHSVDAAFLFKDKIGYIKISKFGRTTFEEFLTSLAKLKTEGANAFIIDLRGNSGGYMDRAINMINEFLPAGQMIVYTEGKAMPRNEFKSDGTGSFPNVPLVVLIDEWSASASEIFAGAIQDNDRGTIIGRRSYGKGLVQNQIPFRDGSALRLTIARYYTPSGRSIQKEYELGKASDYGLDILKRFEHGEFYSKDSIHLNDSLLFRTSMGRKVYGGGGIMPDIFVPHDTTDITAYFNKVANKGLIYQFAFQYTDKHRAFLSDFKTYEELQGYLASQNLLPAFVNFAAKKGVKKQVAEIRKSKDLILKQLESYIIRNVSSEENFYRSFFRDDETIEEAIELIELERTFPQLEPQEIILAN